MLPLTATSCLQNLQKFARLNEISGHLISIHRRHIEAMKTHMARHGYEEPPPKKLHKLSDGNERKGGGFHDEVQEPSDNAPSNEGVDFETDAHSEERRRRQNAHLNLDSASGEERMETNDPESTDTHHHHHNHLVVPPKICGNVEFPKSPPCPVLHGSSSSNLAVNGVVQYHRASSSPTAPGTLTTIQCEDDEETRARTNRGEDEDDSVLAMELPPTPVCPEMNWQPNKGRIIILELRRDFFDFL